mgnify:CR=1 FL=1
MRKFLFAVLAFGIMLQVYPCTTFFLATPDGTMIFGRNFDFPTGQGHICINEKGLKKMAFIQPPEKPLSWVSRYGSISFNQAGREFPYGGMNEAGLVIEQMWLQETQYPDADERYGLPELQWIQYQLDMSATVQELVDSDSLLRITNRSVAPLHFLVSDQNGDVAVVEYLDGEMKVRRGDDLPHPVLANCPYVRSLDFKIQKDEGSTESFTNWTLNSSGRFAKAAKLLEQYQGNENPVDYAFAILDSVGQGPATQWSIVYDLSDQRIYYRTYANRQIKVLDMDDFDFSCDNHDIYADIDQYAESPGDFLPYSYETNLKLIRDVFSNVDFLREHVPDEAKMASAKYPESIVCLKDGTNQITE